MRRRNWITMVYVITWITLILFTLLIVTENKTSKIVDCRDPVVNVVSWGTVLYEYSWMYVVSWGQYRRWKWEDQDPWTWSTPWVTLSVLVDSWYKQAWEQVVHKEWCIPRWPSSERYKAIIEREKWFIHINQHTNEN